jgi:hypothetical protein
MSPRQRLRVMDMRAPAALTVLVGLTLIGCGTSSEASTPSGRPALTNTATSALPTPRPAESRLVVPVDQGYRPGLLSIGNYRMDPAPPSVTPRLTGAQAIHVLATSDAKAYLRLPGARTIARFGLFSGAEAAPTQIGSLGPTNAVKATPAWLVIISGVKWLPVGGAYAPGSAQPTLAPTDGWVLAVVYDDTAALHDGITVTTTDPRAA